SFAGRGCPLPRSSPYWPLPQKMLSWYINIINAKMNIRKGVGAMPADSGAGAAGIGKLMLQFLAITFGLTWGLALLVLMFPQQIVALFGEIHMGHPLFILAVYSPGIAGVIGVWRLHGSAGVGRFLRRLTLWRAP